MQDAQNKVAAFALSRLFPNLPLSQMLSEPYSSFVTKWEESEGVKPDQNPSCICLKAFCHYLLPELHSSIQCFNSFLTNVMVLLRYTPN